MRDLLVEARDQVIRRQQQWAKSLGIEYDSHLRTGVLRHNLFQALNGTTFDEFARGAGGELGNDVRPGKLASLRSSSALAVNLFDAWRYSPPSELLRSLGIPDSNSVVRFEGVFPTGLRGTAPHLDVVVESENLLTGIEVKFVEPYAGVSNGFRDSYFTNESIWEGLERTRDTARAIATGKLSFETLHAAQLIKHALGLKGSGRGFTLVYLWYRFESEAGSIARAEVDRFAELVDSEIAFRSVTVSQLLAAVSDGRLAGSAWFEYINSRYGPEPI